jgi:hypothetical protein
MSKLWYYTENEEWDSDSLDEYESSQEETYTEVAGSIAEELDAQSAHYPDERTFLLMEALHNTPVKVTVYGETVRSYTAKIEKGDYE